MTRQFQKALSNALMTLDMYTGGHSEKIIKEYLSSVSAKEAETLLTDCLSDMTLKMKEKIE